MRLKHAIVAAGTAIMLVLTGSGMASAAVRPVLMGSNYVRTAYFDSKVGLPSKVVRTFHGTGYMPSSLALDPPNTGALAKGFKVVTSFKPDRPATAANLKAFGSWCADVIAHGDQWKVWATVWHEPTSDFPNGAAYVREYNAFQAVAKAHGIRFGPIYNLYPFFHGQRFLDWAPPAARANFIAIDSYAGQDPRGTFTNPLVSMAPELNWAKANGVQFDIAETGIAPRSYGTTVTNAKAAAWILDYKALPDSTRWVMWFDGRGIDIGAYNSVLAPAWRNLYKYLSNR